MGVQSVSHYAEQSLFLKKKLVGRDASLQYFGIIARNSSIGPPAIVVTKKEMWRTRSRDRVLHCKLQCCSSDP